MQPLGYYHFLLRVAFIGLIIFYLNGFGWYMDFNFKHGRIRQGLAFLINDFWCCWPSIKNRYNQMLHHTCILSILCHDQHSFYFERVVFFWFYSYSNGKKQINTRKWKPVFFGWNGVWFASCSGWLAAILYDDTSTSLLKSDVQQSTVNPWNFIGTLAERSTSTPLSGSPCFWAGMLAWFASWSDWLASIDEISI